VRPREATGRFRPLRSRRGRPIGSTPLRARLGEGGAGGRGGFLGFGGERSSDLAAHAVRRIADFVTSTAYAGAEQ
jgi:hypothetical protein